MYSQNNSSNFYDHSSDFINQNYPSNLTPLLIQSLTSEFDSINESFMLTNVNGNTSAGSGCTSSSYIGSPTSPLSYTSSHPPNSTAALMQRSLSSHSLNKIGFHMTLSPPAAGLLDLDFGPVRRVSSTGDLDQGIKTLQRNLVSSPLGNESTSVILEGMTKACRYSPEEKKERIERYRSKRSQRNFNKKIQYECRKTLADSRLRVRGRFARNDEIEQPANNFPDLQWSQTTGEEVDADEGQWIQLLNSLSSNMIP